MDLLLNYYSNDPVFESAAIKNYVECVGLENSIIDELDSMDDSYISEASEESNENKKTSSGVFSKIIEMINKVRQYIVDLFKSIGSMFGKKLDVNNYMNAETTQVKLSQDIEKLYKDSKAQIDEGHKFLKKISNTTGISMDALNEWKDKVTSYTIDNAGPALSAAATVSAGNLIGSLMSDANSNLGAIMKKSKEFNKMENQSGMMKAKAYEFQGKKGMAAMTKLSTGFGSIFRRLGTARVMVERVLGQYDTRFAKNKKKQIKNRRKKERKAKK